MPDNDSIRLRLAHARGEGPPAEQTEFPLYIGPDADGNAVLLPPRFGGRFKTDEGLVLTIKGQVIDGTPECVSLTVESADGAPITSDDLASIAVRDAVNRLVAPNSMVLPKGQPIGAFAAQLGLEQNVAAVLPQRRRRVTRSELQDVARVYRAAFENGDDPTQAVARFLGQSHATAARKVGRARKEGFLGPAPGVRQPGEVTPADTSEVDQEGTR